MENDQYIPGACNIGRAETKMRNLFGWLGLFITVILWALLAYYHAAAPWLLLLFFPAVLSASGFIQGTMHFCANYGMRGRFNVGSEIGKTGSVDSEEFRAEDRRKSGQIIRYSVLIGSCVAVLAFFIG